MIDLDFLKLYKKTTRLTYHSILSEFETLGSPSAVRYITSLKTAGQSYTTIKKKIYCLISYHRFIDSEDNLKDFDLLRDRIKHKRSPQVRPTGLIPDKIIKNITKLKTTTLKELRDKTLFLVILAGALRRSEVLRIKRNDLVSDGSQFAVFLRDTKNGDSVYQPLAQWVTPFLNFYLKEFDFKTTDPLFPSFSGKGGEVLRQDTPMHETTVNLVIKRLLIAQGFKGSTHFLRATAITKLLDLGLTHREVSTFSRHNSIQCLEKYDKKKASLPYLVAKKFKGF